MMKTRNVLTAGLLYAATALPFTAGAQGLRVTREANVVVNGEGFIVVNDGGVINDGNFKAGTGTLSLTGGSSQTSVIGGTTPTQFYRLKFNRGGGYKLGQNVSVTNAIELSGGILDLAGFNLDLGTTGFISGENSSTYITGPKGGFIFRKSILNAPNSNNPGNLGLQISSGENLGLTTIARSHKKPVSANGTAIYRCFDIVPENNNNLHALVKMYYGDQELGDIDERDLTMWSSTDNGTTWELLGKDGNDDAANYVAKNNINSFSRLTLIGNANNSLPIQMLFFKGTLVIDKTVLTWATANETGNKYFEVERATDGVNFTKIATVNGAGTTSSVNNYTHTNTEPLTGMVFYRLKQVDIENHVHYSGIISVYKGDLANKVIQIYPNPTSGPFNVRFTSDQSKQVVLKITSQAGAVVSSKTITAAKGLNVASWSVRELAAGTYYLEVSGIENKAFKINKQ